MAMWPHIHPHLIASVTQWADIQITDIQPWRQPGSGVQRGQLAPPQLHHQGGDGQCGGGQGQSPNLRWYREALNKAMI